MRWFFHHYPQHIKYSWPAKSRGDVSNAFAFFSFFNMIYILIALGEVEVCFSLILMLLNTTDKHYELNNEHKVTERVYIQWMDCLWALFYSVSFIHSRQHPSAYSQRVLIQKWDGHKLRSDVNHQAVLNLRKT